MAKVAAIFDLDNTLLNDNSGKLIAQYLMRTGQVSRFFGRKNIASIIGTITLYKMGVLSADQAMRRSARNAANIRLDELWDLVDLWFQEVVIEKITDQAQQVLGWHRTLDHKLVICSAASQFSVAPVAKYLNIPHSIHTSWLEKAGRLTGEYEEPAAYGAGKVYWMKKWAKEHNVDLAKSYFYTDHISDRPLLELVAHPVAVNPDKQLRKIAKQRQWQIVEWKD